MKVFSPRERVLSAMRHQNTDKIPFSWGFGINVPARYGLQKYLSMDSMETLDAYLLSVDDIRNVDPAYIGPSDRVCINEDGVKTDEWGVKWKFQSFGNGGYDEQYENPLADAESVEDILAYRFPLADWWDPSCLPQKIKTTNCDNQYAIRMGNGNMFERASWLRGFENILMDTIAQPDMLHMLMRKVTDYFLAYFHQALDAAKGQIDIVFTADDIGGQNGLLMSKKAILEFIAPYHKELNDMVHSYGAKVMYHSCGSVVEAVPILMEAGVDILESLQFFTKGMEPQILKDSFGSKLCFHGGVSVQRTLFTGTPNDVSREVESLTNILGKDGGYILAPAHAIQAGTPPENIMAMLESAGRPMPENMIYTASKE
jgi:uroporphyrinogen decarboxylase